MAETQEEKEIEDVFKVEFGVEEYDSLIEDITCISEEADPVVKKDLQMLRERLFEKEVLRGTYHSLQAFPKEKAA